MKYILCRGCPASGKTTWAKDQINGKSSLAERDLWKRLNRDDVRRDMFGFKQWNEYKFSKKKEEKVTRYLANKLKFYAEKGINVIDDNTNLSRFQQTQKDAEALGYTVEYKDFFNVHLHELIERNLMREYSVPEKAIHEMFKKQLSIQNRLIVKDDSKPDVVIVDIDGTVADMGKGLPWGRQPFEWHKVSQDRPKANVIEMVKLLAANNKIVFLSGREAVCYKDTYEWISKYVMQNPTLLMRAKGDHRPDCVIKEELLRSDVLPSYNVKLCLDDRKQICDFYRCLGLEVWQVDQGMF